MINMINAKAEGTDLYVISFTPKRSNEMTLVYSIHF